MSPLPTESAQSRSAGGADRVLLVVTGAMLLLIIVLLGVLWLRTRSQLYDARAELIKAQNQSDGRIMLSQLLKDKPIHLRVDRAGLTSRPATLDGKAATALHLPASIGQEFGFRAGDVIVVDQPTSAPAGVAAEP
jgi:hypothetical protein